MAKYKLTFTIETKQDLKFPQDAALLEEVEGAIYSELNGYVEMSPSVITEITEDACKHDGDVLFSDSIATCKFSATCQSCGLSVGGFDTMEAAAKALEKL